MAKETKTVTEEIKVAADDLARKVEELIREGNIRRIIVKDEKGKTYLEIPLTAGVIGIVIAPLLAALGVIAAYASKFTIEIVRDEPGAGKGVKRAK